MKIIGECIVFEHLFRRSDAVVGEILSINAKIPASKSIDDLIMIECAGKLSGARLQEMFA